MPAAQWPFENLGGNGKADWGQTVDPAAAWPAELWEPSELDLAMAQSLEHRVRPIRCFAEFLEPKAADLYRRPVTEPMTWVGGELVVYRMVGCVAPLSRTGDQIPEFVEALAAQLNLLAQHQLLRGVLAGAFTVEVVPYGIDMERLDRDRLKSINKAVASTTLPAQPDPIGYQHGGPVLRRAFYLSYPMVRTDLSDGDLNDLLGAPWAGEEGGMPEVGVFDESGGLVLRHLPRKVVG